MVTRAEVAIAVSQFEAMAFFQSVSGAARKLICESLLRLVNVPCPAHTDYCECSRPKLRNHAGVLIETPPGARLRIFVEAFVRLPGGWPGIAEMEAIYCQLWPPGDGIARPSPTTPGYTFADHAEGVHVPLLPEKPEPLLIAGEVMTEAERAELTAKFTVALAKLRIGDAAEA